MKDTWTKPKGVGTRVGGGDEWGGVVGCKWRQLYLNNKKIATQYFINKLQFLGGPVIHIFFSGEGRKI